MREATRDRLLELNREFYATVAQPFDATRQSWTPGKSRLLTYVPSVDDEKALRVADIGCGNGRLAMMLESLAMPCSYVGVDGNAELIELARRQTNALQHVQTRFIRADLAAADWPQQLGRPTPQFDMVVCLATLQHMPGRDLRLAVVRGLTSLMAPGALLALSAWQFLTSPRFISRQIEWATVGIAAEEVEAGDALLPWKQGVYALRYVHQIDEEELEFLTREAGLVIRNSFRADGKEGNLNLYAICTMAAEKNGDDDG